MATEWYPTDYADADVLITLRRAGFRLRSFDLNGRGNCRTAAEAARGADVLVTMVPDGKAVKAASAKRVVAKKAVAAKPARKTTARRRA